MAAEKTLMQHDVQQRSEPDMQEPNKPSNPPPKKKSVLANLAFNIIIPTLILSKLAGDNYLGPIYSVVVALAFPLVYGIRDYFISHKPNFISALGVVSVLLTGGMSLLKLDPQYIAIKDAAIPGLLGLATLISMYTRYPLVRTFLYNDQVLQVAKVSAALAEHNTATQFERRLSVASYMIAGSFFLSAILNYILARLILVSSPGTTAFSEELGKMTALSFPVIVLPSMLVLMGAMMYLLNAIQKLTHLTLDDIFQEM